MFSHLIRSTNVSLTTLCSEVSLLELLFNNVCRTVLSKMLIEKFFNLSFVSLSCLKCSTTISSRALNYDLWQQQQNNNFPTQQCPKRQTYWKRTWSANLFFDLWCLLWGYGRTGRDGTEREGSVNGCLRWPLHWPLLHTLLWLLFPHTDKKWIGFDTLNKILHSL